MKFSTKIALWWWRWVWRFHILTLVLLLGGLLTPSVPPNKTLIFFLLGFAFYILSAFNLLFCVAWWWRKEQKRLLIGLIAFVITIFPLMSFVNISVFKPKHKDNSQILKILSMNTGTIKNIKDASVISFFDNTDADIICLQEWIVPQSIAYYRKNNWTFLDKYPHIAGDKNMNTVILSKYPIVKQGALTIKYDLDGGIDGTIFADINIHGKIVRVYNCHLMSYIISNTVDILAQSSPNKFFKRTSDIKRIAKQLKRVAPKRLEQAQVLAKHIKECSHNIVLSGDFNEVPQSYIYALLRGDMKDAFRERGHGFGITFNGNLPALKIDYTFCSPNINVLEHRIDDNMKFSDHFPLITVLELP